MNAVARGGVGVRVFVTGKGEAVRDFRDFRDEGKRAFSEIAGGARQANPALVALSRGVGEVKGQVNGLADRAGPASGVLAAFGVVGVGAAAAMGGLSIALTKARESLSFADEIGDAAAKIGVSTDALQEMRYAVHQTGGEFTDADTALAAFTRALGAAESGLSPKLARAFKSLGLSDADLKRLKDDVPSALEEVADRIAGLSSEAERAAIADKLGLTPMLPLLREGASGMEELRGQARQLGVVMDSELIAKAGDLNDELEVLHDKIHVQLMSAFVGLGPVLVSATEKFANLLEAVSNFVNDPRTQRAVEMIGHIAGSAARGAASGGINGAVLGAGRGVLDELSRDHSNWIDVDDPYLIRMGAVTARPKPVASGGVSLQSPPTRPATPKKPKLPGVPLGSDYAQTSYDPLTGKPNRVRSAQDWSYFDSMGFFPGEGPEAAKPKVNLDLDMSHPSQQLDAWLEDARQDVKYAFSDGIMAAFDGHLLDFIRSRLVESLADSLADSFADLWTQASKGKAGGGIGKFIVDGVNTIFGGKRKAVGGDVRPGDLSSVAEYGDELAFFGKGGRIFDSNETVRMLQQVAGGGRGDVSVHFAPVIDARGADREGLRRVEGQLAAMQQALPAMIQAQAGPAAHDWLQDQHILPRSY